MKKLNKKAVTLITPPPSWDENCRALPGAAAYDQQLAARVLLQPSNSSRSLSRHPAARRCRCLRPTTCSSPRLPMSSSPRLPPTTNGLPPAYKISARRRLRPRLRPAAPSSTRGVHSVAGRWNWRFHTV
ncbi:hypothetical protein BRADI_3g41735v3 [Brachypodium distachyon]|uniref:Uncharacterized protein n=1 Tax=Brachypodium distachyon TaxID=15368 RepID=A0A2K2D2J9_BRADI|nr:hypothetical protein BRADI_3g41735v3 [Brachypodium distachyon]